MGRDDLASRFDPHVGLVRDPFLTERHSPHNSLWYAIYLLESGEVDTASAIIEKVLGMQELREGDPHYGNFRWHFEDEVVVDVNACQFVLEALCHMPLDRLSSALRDRVFQAMRLALVEADRLDVHWTYTNIYLHDVQNRIVGGQIIGDEGITERGGQRLAAWADRTREVGAPHEFNSPTYAAIDLNALAGVANRALDENTRQLALEMEHLVWRHVAKYWHAGTMQSGGPHSRAYRRDVVGAAGFLKVVLYKLLGDARLLADVAYYSGYAAEGASIVARTQYHCPPDAEAMFREPRTRLVRETVALAPRTEAVACITPEFTLGTMSRPYGVGDPPEPWPANDSCIAYWVRQEEPGYGVLYCRSRVNSGPTGEPSSHAVPSWFDIWEEGLFRSAQTGSRAVVAYGLAPRGQRPVTSLRLDIRLLGAEEVLIAGRAWDGAQAIIDAGQPVVVQSGDALIGIVPFAPTDLGRGAGVVLWRDGHETVLSIANYEGPPKQFWEYRSLAGPFWKGNVRNGFALWVAPRGDFASAEEFRDILVSTPVRDELDGSLRRITFGDVTLEYDLREMWP